MRLQVHQVFGMDISMEKYLKSGVYNFHLDFNFGSGEKGSRQGTIRLIR